jgi:hypothetical protein
MSRYWTIIVSIPLVLACSGDRPPDRDEAAVTSVGIYVLPYYEAATTARGRPMVAVGRAFDGLLASNNRRDILRVRNAIQAEPEHVTPITLMVLAIRLYDVGARDDAVFWFYVAKDRFATMAAVLDLGAPELAQHADAVLSFNTLAGPIINGYAFCDPTRQRELRRDALEWVEQSPYQALFMAQLPARPGDRQANLRRAIAELRAAVEEEGRYLEDPANLAEFNRLRAENRAGEKYCWTGS